MTTTINLGRLQLRGETLLTYPQVVEVTIHDNRFWITPEEWQSLAAVSSVIALAREVKQLDEIETGLGGGLNCGSKTLVDKMAGLYDAIDRLSAAGGEEGE